VTNGQRDRQTERQTDRETDRQTDGRTDGIAMAYTRYSIYAVARKNKTDYSYTHTHTQTNVLRLDGFCPGQPG